MVAVAGAVAVDANAATAFPRVQSSLVVVSCSSPRGAVSDPAASAAAADNDDDDDDDDADADEDVGLELSCFLSSSELLL